MMKNKIAVIITIAMVMIAIFEACGGKNYAPRPKGYFRIDFPEKTYKQLVKETERVAARWNELMAVDRLQEKLVRFGLEMNIPRADQVVRMNAAGRPLPGQIAVVRARERMATANMAQVAPAAQPRKGTTRRKIR